MIKTVSPRSKKGFTIIEVVLVLAIAGLIFLMVFIALPMLQRAQRNTQREDDLARFLSAVVDYQSNNRQRTPFRDNPAAQSITQFVTRYIDDTCADPNNRFYSQGLNFVTFGPRPDNDSCTGDQFRDPDGTIYRFIYFGNFGALTNGGNMANISIPTNQPDRTAHNIFVISGAVCGVNEGTAARAAGQNYIAMFMVLEGGAITCVTNGTRGVGPVDSVMQPIAG